MFLNTPVICSNIKENIFAVADTAILFEQGNVDSLKEALTKSLNFHLHTPQMEYKRQSCQRVSMLLR